MKLHKLCMQNVKVGCDDTDMSIVTGFSAFIFAELRVAPPPGEGNNASLQLPDGSWQPHHPLTGKRRISLPCHQPPRRPKPKYTPEKKKTPLGNEDWVQRKALVHFMKLENTQNLDERHAKLKQEQCCRGSRGKSWELSPASISPAPPTLICAWKKRRKEGSRSRTAWSYLPVSPCRRVWWESVLCRPAAERRGGGAGGGRLNLSSFNFTEPESRESLVKLPRSTNRKQSHVLSE